jgi:hypothetical protein
MSQNTIRYEPIGVCVGIVPWNFPLLLGLWKAAPALAAGNSVILKPDEKTPLSLLALAQICLAEGVPPGVFNLVTGDGEEVGAHLAAHPDVDKVAFTGSTAVGREIMRLASATVKKVSLELGGKGPVVVLDDADVATAVDAAICDGAGRWIALELARRGRARSVVALSPAGGWRSARDLGRALRRVSAGRTLMQRHERLHLRGSATRHRSPRGPRGSTIPSESPGHDTTG